MNLKQKITKPGKLSDRQIVEDYLKNGDLYNQIKKVIDQIDTIKANINQKVLVDDEQVGWALFWKILVQYLQLALTYDEARFSSIKAILLKIKN